MPRNGAEGSRSERIGDRGCGEEEPRSGLRSSERGDIDGSMYCHQTAGNGVAPEHATAFVEPPTAAGDHLRHSFDIG